MGKGVLGSRNSVPRGLVFHPRAQLTRNYGKTWDVRRSLFCFNLFHLIFLLGKRMSHGEHFLEAMKPPGSNRASQGLFELLNLE